MTLRPTLSAALLFAFTCAAGPALGQESASTQPATRPAGEFSSMDERAAYAIGVSLGQNLKQQGIELDADIVARGLTDVLRDRKPALGPRQMQEALTALQQSLQAKSEAEAEQNLEEGTAFLEARAEEEDVRVTDSGLQYKIIEEGEGESPSESDRVKVHYTGTLVDGTEFDSSRARGEPAVFRVDRVIAGWTEALTMMKPGAHWQLYLPPDLAYGQRGAGGQIGPNAVLVFDVELLEVLPDESPEE